MKILKCKICGNEAILINEGGGIMTCCNEKMEEVLFNQYDDKEYHIPEYSIDKCILTVSVAKHPNTKDHYIEKIVIITNYGLFLKRPDCNQSLKIKLEKNEKVLAIYALCNIHGWWMANIA